MKNWKFWLWLALSILVSAIVFYAIAKYAKWDSLACLASCALPGLIFWAAWSHGENERLHREEVAELKYQCNTLLSRLNVLHEECASADLRFHESHNRVHELENDLDTSREELERLRKSEAALQESNAALNSDRVKLHTLESVHQKLRLEQEHGRSELEGLRRVSLDETSKCARLEQELKTVLLILAEVVADLFHAPKNTQGSDLRSLRMRVLDAAYVGFRGLQQFTWATHKKPVEGYLYRDHAQYMLSLGADLSQQWVADYVRYAHGHRSSDDQTGTASQSRAAIVETSDDVRK
ncbi:MAG: hypothetical protein PHS79_06030 [Patescibacteria group bacterium]|nr:hypothetical protein [Patescibacteria group bacterium]